MLIGDSSNRYESNSRLNLPIKSLYKELQNLGKNRGLQQGIFIKNRPFLKYCWNGLEVLIGVLSICIDDHENDSRLNLPIKSLYKEHKNRRL